MIKILIFAFLILALLIAIWFFFLRGEGVKKASHEGPIIFFGDSLTAGVGAGPGEDFPSLIAKELNLTNVVNAGISGDTTADALNRLQPNVLSKNPSLVVVLLGGNDFLTKDPIDTTVKNMDQIVQRISESGAAVVLVHFKSNPLSDKYKEPAENIAKKYGAAFVPDVMDGILGNSDLMADQIHPNAKGYKIMADRILPEVKKALE